jgi:ribosomal protein S6--L-glutamate ligase
VKVVILSRNASLYSTRRLKEAGQRRGHDVRVIDYLRCYMNITSVEPTIMFQDELLRGVDAVVPRIGVSHSTYGAAIVRQFEITGVFCANGSEAIVRSHDKLRCLQILAECGLGLPATGFAHSSKDLDALIRSVGGAPLVVKLLNRNSSIGAILVESRQAAGSVIEAFQGLDAESLVQQFVQESAGRSLRLFVVGGRVVAAIERSAPAGEFRSNLHRGARAQRVQLTSVERRVAVQAAHALDLRVAGVDMLRSRFGPLVIGINASPELEIIEGTSRVDVAERIFRYIERSVGKRPVLARVAG